MRACFSRPRLPAAIVLPQAIPLPQTMRLCDVAKRNGYDLKPIFQPATAFPFFRQARTRPLFSTVVVRCQTRWALEFGTTPYVSGTAVSDTVACRAPLAARLRDMQRALLPCFRASSPSSLATKDHMVRKRRKPCVPLVPLVPSLGSQRLPFLPCVISATLPLLAAGGRLRGSGARQSGPTPPDSGTRVGHVMAESLSLECQKMAEWCYFGGQESRAIDFCYRHCLGHAWLSEMGRPRS